MKDSTKDIVLGFLSFALVGVMFTVMFTAFYFGMTPAV